MILTFQNMWPGTLFAIIVFFFKKDDEPLIEVSV